MSDFDNWKEEQERIHNDYGAENAWYAGQQSQQAKIDELQARIDEVLDYVGDDFTDYYTGVMTESIHEILKGTTNEQ